MWDLPDQGSNPCPLHWQVDSFFYYYYLFYFIYLWLCWVFVSVRGLSPAVASGGPLFIAVRGSLTIAASPAAEHRLQMHRLSNCGPWAQPLRGTWDPPRPGLEPVSPTTAPPGKPKAGGFLTTVPPGKSPTRSYLFKIFIYMAVLGLSCSMHVGSSSLTRDRIRAPCTGSTES